MRSLAAMRSYKSLRSAIISVEAVDIVSAVLYWNYIILFNVFPAIFSCIRSRSSAKTPPTMRRQP